MDRWVVAGIITANPTINTIIITIITIHTRDPRVTIDRGILKEVSKEIKGEEEEDTFEGRPMIPLIMAHRPVHLRTVGMGVAEVVSGLAAVGGMEGTE